VGNPLSSLTGNAMPGHHDHRDQQIQQAAVSEHLDQLLNPTPNKDRAAEDDASKVSVGEHPDDGFEEWLEETQIKLPEDDEKG